MKRGYIRDFPPPLLSLSTRCREHEGNVSYHYICLHFSNLCPEDMEKGSILDGEENARRNKETKKQRNRRWTDL